jgi:hypothetical protein
MIGMTVSMTAGSVEHAPDRTLRAYIETLAPYDSHQRFNEKIGLHTLRLESVGTCLSIDPQRPTVFTGETRHVLPEGESIPNLYTGEEDVLLQNVPVRTHTLAAGFLADHRFSGRFESTVSMLGVQLGLLGRFSVHLS